MVGLSCQFKMYVNIMLENNKMVQDGCVKRNRGVIRGNESPIGEEERGLWGN